MQGAVVAQLVSDHATSEPASGAERRLGEPLLQARGRVHKVEGVRTIATFQPRQMLGRPSDKAHVWRYLLLLMEEEL